MTKEEGCEWYQSNHCDFAYNLQCFLDTHKGLISRFKSQKTGFSVECKKNVVSVLMGIRLPKKLVPDYTSRYCCHVAAWVSRELGTSNCVNWKQVNRGLEIRSSLGQSGHSITKLALYFSLTRIASGESIWGSRSTRDRLLKNEWS